MTTRASCPCCVPCSAVLTGLLRGRPSPLGVRRPSPLGRFAAGAAWVGVLLGLGCGSGEGDDGLSPAASVDIGLPGGEDGLQFVRLEPGASIPLQTFGQGGTHALLAVRTSGLGTRAFIGVTITNIATGDAVSAPPGPGPRSLICRSPDACDLLPLLVMTGGLVAPGADRNGLNVRVRVDAENPDGVSASVERDAVLSTEQL